MSTQNATHQSTSDPAIVFTSCGLMPAQAPQVAAPARSGKGSAKPAGKRREVKIKGKRVRTIDVHAHCLIPAASKLVGDDAYNHHTGGIVCEGQDLATRLRAMDAQGLDMEALSINPFWYRTERDKAAEIVRLNNEGLVEICAKNPDRFVAFASVALQFPDLAVQQLEHAVKKLGLRGAAVGASCAGEEFAHEKFHPFWAKCEELGVLVFMHPLGTRELEPSGRLAGNGLLTNTIGNPLETTIALSHLIFEGTLDRFPGLKICAAHGGGFLPSYANRSDAVIKTFPDRVGPLPKKNPTEYLRNGQLYFDTIMFTGEAMRHLIAEVGIEHVVMGTDYPFPWNTAPVDHILSIPGISDADKVAILGATAARLLGIDS